jgi:hypothetical protein
LCRTICQPLFGVNLGSPSSLCNLKGSHLT